MERLIVDRIEDGIAVCEKEDLSHIEIPASSLPENAREGSAIFETDGGYMVDEAYTASRREQVLKKQTSVFKKRKNL